MDEFRTKAAAKAEATRHAHEELGWWGVHVTETRPAVYGLDVYLEVRDEDGETDTLILCVHSRDGVLGSREGP